MKANWKICAAAFAGLLAASAPAAAQDKSFNLRLASAIPGTTPIAGQGAEDALRQIEAVSGGSVRIRYYDPGALVPAGEVFEAVSRGSVDAGWHSGGLLTSRIPAMNYFAATPFGPPAAELLAWYYFGGGKEIHHETYAQHNVRPVVCLILPPESSGWFRKEINSPTDISGLKLRMSGLGGEVMNKLGASSQMLPAGEVYGALERGVIDAAEISIPQIDEQLGLHTVAEFFYFPGWHQTSTFWELLINLDTWNEMSDMQKAQVEAACTANVTLSQAKGEASQSEPLQRLADAGAQLREWTPEMLETFRNAWEEVADEYAAEDELFARTRQSLEDFRAKYAEWYRLAYMK